MGDLVEALSTFVRVAECGSFSVVAAEIRASHTTIARRIDFLEDRFGARLFQRSTRHMKLTDDGGRLLHHARAILADIDLAESELGKRRADAEGLLRVGVTTALGLFLSRNLLGKLYDLYPRLRIHLMMSDTPANMVEEGMDLSFRVGEISEDSLIQRHIGDVRRSLVASPRYLADKAIPKAVHQLRFHELVGYSYDRLHPNWVIDSEHIPVEGRFTCNSSEAAHQAVLAGLGIGLLPTFQIQGDVAAGDLIHLLPKAMIEPLRLSIAWPPGHRLSSKVRAFIEFASTEIAPLVCSE
jgi:DNA-binding transcriptional LysR family regulator